MILILNKYKISMTNLSNKKPKMEKNFGASLKINELQLVYSMENQWSTFVNIFKKMVNGYRRKKVFP